MYTRRNSHSHNSAPLRHLLADLCCKDGRRAQMRSNELQRREFLATLAALSSAAQGLNAASSDGMIYRKFGSTNEKISAIGLGGYHIGVPKDADEGIKIIRSAL